MVGSGWCGSSWPCSPARPAGWAATVVVDLQLVAAFNAGILGPEFRS
jgi:hypothetical protein